jgi:hypothetical protein
LPASHLHPHNVLFNWNIQTFCILFIQPALFSGLLGTAFYILIRLELSGPGVQYIADNQLYNSIITAHAILMIFFMAMPALIERFGNLYFKLYNICSLVYKGYVKLVYPPLTISESDLEAYSIAERNNVLQSSMLYFLDVDLLHSISEVSNKFIPLLETSFKLPIKTSLDTILPMLNVNTHTISSTLTVESNTIDNSKIEFLANNFVHIFNMNNIAIEILCNKVNTCSSYVMDNFNLHKSIPLLERYYISSVSCSWGHSWSINTSSIYTTLSALHQYSIYFIPLLVPLLNSISILIFNIFEMYLHYLYSSLRFLSRIISNSILLIIRLIELLFFLYAHMLNQGIRRSLADFFIWYIGILDYYSDYVRICLYCNKWLSFETYDGYVRAVNYISSYLNELTELIRTRTRLITRLQRRMRDGIYIIGHPNPRWNNIHGRHILTLQVSNGYRLRTVNLQGQCRVIATLFTESANTDDQRILLVNLINVDRWLSRINTNYISEFEPLYNELFLLEETRSRIFGTVSYDFNNFIVVRIYDSGHIEYIYIWDFEF